MYNGCLKHATKLIPEKDGQGKTWQQILQVAMVTETEWYAREAKFLIPRLEFGPNVVLMDGLWMENKTELHSKALEKKSDFRMCLADVNQRGIFNLNL